MADGMEKEATLIEGLRRLLKIRQNRIWDVKYCVDLVVDGPRNFDGPFLRTPIAVQLTWFNDSRAKRNAAYETLRQFSDRFIYIEIASEEVTPYIVHGVYAVILHLFFCSETPQNALIKIDNRGRYTIFDFDQDIVDYEASVSASMQGNLEGRLVFWSPDGNHGFIEVERSKTKNEPITFYVPKNNVDPNFRDWLEVSSLSGNLSYRQQPSVILEDGGTSNKSSRRLAINVRKK